MEYCRMTNDQQPLYHIHWLKNTTAITTAFPLKTEEKDSFDKTNAKPGSGVSSGTIPVKMGGMVTFLL